MNNPTPNTSIHPLFTHPLLIHLLLTHPLLTHLLLTYYSPTTHPPTTHSLTTPHPLPTQSPPTHLNHHQIVGWAMMVGGVWVHLYREQSHLGVLLRDNPTSPLLVSDRIAVLLIVSGAVVSLVGFLGCCGACTESVCFLGFVSGLMGKRRT